MLNKQKKNLFLKAYHSWKLAKTQHVWWDTDQRQEQRKTQVEGLNFSQNQSLRYLHPSHKVFQSLMYTPGIDPRPESRKPSSAACQAETDSRTAPYMSKNSS